MLNFKNLFACDIEDFDYVSMDKQTIANNILKGVLDYIKENNEIFK